MNLLPWFEWLEATAVAGTIKQSIWLFPVIECVHLLALALLGGTILVVDLRTLGFGLTPVTPGELARKLQPWMTGALLTMIATGVPMFLSEAIKCYYSPPFWYKMALLLVATAFTYTLRGRWTKPAALVSLALWFGVGFAGRWIAFY